ncbi:MAG: hypothetical protein JW915_14020 [Chitinispirillaceae bacterium]|nr:hypothetical protein [Chitinispirillaceae bacterium]
MKENVKEKLFVCANTLYSSLADTVLPYNILKNRCSEFNAIVDIIEPVETRWQLYLEAHHIIEKRHFEVFKNYFKLIGINNTDVMPAVALHKMWHRMTTRKKLDEWVPSVRGMKGLTGELLEKIKFVKITDISMLQHIYISAYWDFPNVQKKVIDLIRELRAAILSEDNVDIL